MTETTAFAGWQDITNDSGSPGVSVAWRIDKRGSHAAEMTLNKRLIAEIGWASGHFVRIKLAPDRRSVALVPDETGKRLAMRVYGSGTVTHRFSWVTSDRRPAQMVQHSVVDGAVVLALPEWAWPTDGAAEGPVERVKPASKPAAQPASLPASTQPKPAAAAVPRPQATSTPLVRAEDTINPPAGDLAEAAVMVRNGSGGMQLAEYFGWDGKMAADFAEKIREAAKQAAA